MAPRKNMARRRPPTAGSPVPAGLHFLPSLPVATNKKVASRLTEIPDHLLAEIFLRLPAPEDLARASAACVSFRRLVTDRSFLRSFRRLHAPPLLGFLDCASFNPALPPHPSAPAARALANFSLSFLPSHCRWVVQDIRDGRVLLVRDPEEDWCPLFSILFSRIQPPVPSEIVVCDPLHRRYVLLPSLPEDLAASVEHFLVPLGEESEAAFRVICVAHCETRLAAFVFSSNTRQWQAAASKSWSDLFLGRGELTRTTLMDPTCLKRHYAYGCFYWDYSMIKGKELLVLDTQRMEFSITDLPPGNWRKQGLAIVGAGEGRLGDKGWPDLLKLGYDLTYTSVRNKGESPSQWQMEKIISLDSEYQYSIRDATERYMLFIRVKSSSLQPPLFEYFSMDIKTLQIQRVCSTHRRPSKACIYTNFPPLLSSKAI
ncbi:hypothetical protein ACQ4PT_001087 [Festuca glaucescens]